MFKKSNILRSPHAFSTREGGVSRHEHTSSLNLAFGRGDDDATVIQNLEIFAENVGFDPQSVISLPQIHSDRIFTATKADRGRGYYVLNDLDSGDGYITNERDITLGIKTADCVPILMEAEINGKVAAVGAVHAGWRGTVGGIAVKCVDRLVVEFGADVKNIRVAIGPSIHKCCYEVSQDLYDAVKDGVGEGLAQKFVTLSKASDGKYFCDLAGLNRELLLLRGICADNMEIVPCCTCCNPEMFFSHRYSRGLRGTMLSVIFIN